MPINSDQLTWNAQARHPDWADLRDRWQIAHALRTAAAILAFGLLSTAATASDHAEVPPHKAGMEARASVYP